MLRDRVRTIEALAKLPFRPRNLNEELKAHMGVTLRLEKLNGKCLLEKETDMIMRNCVRLLYALFANYESETGMSITITDYGGSARTGIWGTAQSEAGYVRKVAGMTSAGGISWALSGDNAIDTRGILIGIGTTAPTRTDYMMQNKIAHGSSSGQITYNRQTYELLSDYQFRLNREFTNAGSNLSVAEAGLVYGVSIGTRDERDTLLLRDTFTPISVTTGNGIRVRYTWGF